MKLNNDLKKNLLLSFSKIKKKKLALHEPLFFGNEKKFLNECILDNAVASVGNFLKKFENSIRRFTGAKYCVLFCNGTSAIHIGLQTLGVKKNDEVLIPNINYIASANACLYLNAIPHFVDVDINSLGIDILGLKKYLRNNTKIKNNRLFNKKTKRYITAIVPLHLYGYPCQIDELLKIAKIYKLKVLEDAAESFGSFFKNKHLGTFGDAGVLSFNGNKIITSGGGGALITNNKKIAIKAKKLANIGKKKHTWKMIFDEKGYNYRMPNINAALGFAQIQKIKKILSYKKIIFKSYKKIFFKNIYFSIYCGLKDSSPNHWLITIVLKKKYTKFHESIIKFLISNDIEARPIFEPMTKIKYLNKYPAMNLNKSLNIAKRIINLPSSPQLYKYFNLK
jgi:perosamine synthetase